MQAGILSRYQCSNDEADQLSDHAEPRYSGTIILRAR